MSDYIVNFLNIFVGIRKSLVMIAVLVIATLFRLKGYVDGGQFVDLCKATVLGFFGANGVEHFTAMVKSHLDSKKAVAIIDSDSSSNT